MTTHVKTAHLSVAVDLQNEASSTKIFGFWVYLMTDLTIFAALFACFLVLHGNSFDGPKLKELYHLGPVLYETLCLLTSTLTCALGLLAAYRAQKGASILFFILTFCLGAAFLFLEISEFISFIGQGAGPERSAALSSFFTLVGTHGFHITCGLIWMVIMMFRIGLYPLTHHALSRIFCMALFWHFLDFVWIFIFTVVYGIGYLL